MKSKGFTLLELLIVVAIIGLISAIFIVSTAESRVKSRNVAVISQMYEYQKSLELYYSNNGVYPATNFTRTARFCFGDNPVGSCMAGASATANDSSLINTALRNHMSSLPRFSQPIGSNVFSSPAYSGCVGTGVLNTSCSTNDYSFWFLLEGTDRDCGRATVANPSLSDSYTLCRLQAGQ